MNRKRSFFHHKLLSYTLIALLLTIIGCPLNPAPTQARPLGSPRGANKSNGVRGECYAVDQERPLTALVDRSDPTLTTQANPTFLFYLPYSQSPYRSLDGHLYKTAIAEFELLDENEQSVLKNQKIVFYLPDNPGIVKIKLPSSETVLEPDKEYFWIFRIICDRNDNTANPSVAGWIKRVRVGSSPNVWFDRLEQLAQSPTNDLEQWTQILREVDPKLENLAQAPVVELEPEPLGKSKQENNACYNQSPTRTYGAQ